MRERLSRRRDERGAVLVFVALAMSLLLVVAALAVDLGMQRVLRRDLQALADTVALDVARELDGRTTDELSGEVDAAWRASLARNAAGLDRSPELEVTLGTSDGTGFSPTRGGEVPNAVRVVAQGEVEFAFASGDGGAARSAVARTGDPVVCFSLGTRALTLDTTAGALSPLLAEILEVNLSASGYTGLVDLKSLSVPLVGLLTELNVGSVDELATTEVSLSGFVAAMATVLGEEGQTAAVAVLEGLRIGVEPARIVLGEILGLQTGGDLAGLVAEVNALDLLGVAILAATKTDGIVLGIPGVAQVTVVEPPVIACGGEGTTAESAQIDVDVDLAVPAQPGLDLLGATVRLPIQVGQATATVARELSCEPEQVVLDVSTGAVRVLPAESGSHLEATVEPTVLNAVLAPLDPFHVVRGLLAALGLGQVTIAGSVAATIGSSRESVTISYPDPPAMPAGQVVPQSGTGSVLTLQPGTALSLPPDRNAGVTAALGLLLNPVLEGLLGSVVTPLVNTVLNPLLTGVLAPVLELLGGGLGVAEVDMQSRPRCDVVRLTG